MKKQQSKLKRDAMSAHHPKETAIVAVILAIIISVSTKHLLAGIIPIIVAIVTISTGYTNKEQELLTEYIKSLQPGTDITSVIEMLGNDYRVTEHADFLVYLYYPEYKLRFMFKDQKLVRCLELR